MNRELAEKIANTVLYEGYMLYPYRASSVKNQQRWNFGTLYPPAYEEVVRGTEQAKMHVECLFSGKRDAEIAIRVRFLQFLSDQTEGWNQTAERSTEFGIQPAEKEGSRALDIGGIVAAVRFSAVEISSDVSKLTVELSNQTALAADATRVQALPSAMISAHIILYAMDGEFVSLLDPAENLRGAAGQCNNVGCFPVLVGQAGERDMLLCSPIILYDYPQIAPESAGDFFDGTEMDEMLTLRVLTLTPEEKQAMSATDDRARQLLERTEQSALEQLRKTHGTIRSMRPVSKP